jgi:tRNA(fMet)-specific endonuclease VapC
MRRVLLDTDTLSEILKGKNANVVRRATEYANEHGRFTYSAVSVLEILYGLHHKDAKQQLARAEASFNENEVVVPNLEDYKIAGRIRGIARLQGRLLTSDDCLVGAVADRLGLPVVTGNTMHFEAMRSEGLGIALQNWREI